MTQTVGYERLADDSIRTFAGMSEDAKRVHPAIAAHESLACEAMLDAGIDAFHNIQRADFKARKAALLSKVPLHDDHDSLIARQIKKWLFPVAGVLAWANECETNGTKPQNLPDFQSCVSEAEAILRFSHDAEVPDGIRVIEQESLAKYRRGETVEIFSERESNS